VISFEHQISFEHHGAHTEPSNLFLLFSIAAALSSKRRRLNLTVEVPSLVEVKLDGKAVRLDKVLQLKPWCRRENFCGASEAGSSSGGAGCQPGVAGAAVAPSSAAGRNALAGGGGSSPIRTKPFKQLEFTVKAAATMVGQEAPVLPARLQQWALKVMTKLCWCLAAVSRPFSPLPLQVQGQLATAERCTTGSANFL
jgi:hypothetical protein